MTKQPSCEDRIDNSLARCTANFQILVIDPDDAAFDEIVEFLDDRVSNWRPSRDEDENDNDYHERVDEEAREQLRQYQQERMDDEILGVSTQVTVTLCIELSTGGPADFLTADMDPSSGAVDNVKYHYHDWFDGAVRDVPKGTPLFELCERYASSYEGLSLEDLAS